MTRKATVALGFLIPLHSVVLLAGFLAPYPFDEQHRDYPHTPPSKLHFRDGSGRFHLNPFVYDQQGQTATIHFLSGGRLFRVDPPAALFLLGSDEYGRDVLSRVLYGGQISLMAGLGAAFLSVMFGLILGMSAGFYGGWVDQALMRIGELVMALPWLYLLLAVRAFLPLHVSPTGAFLLVVLLIGSVGWVRPARLIRTVVLSTRQRGFVVAARGLGASDIYLLRRHILPFTWGVALTQATILIPQYILAEVTLSFLGLGVGEPRPSWGNMLAEARQYHTLVSHVWMLAPGVILVCVLFGYLLLADDLLDHNQVN